MATEMWISNFCVACASLLAPEENCQKNLEKKLKDIDTDYNWFDEILDEAYQLFTLKSTKLEQMPKTPSLKQKGHKRTRQDKRCIPEEDESRIEPSRAVSTKINFEEKSPEEKINVDNSLTSDSSRPVRNCRKTSKAVYVEDDIPVKKGIRQSRRAINRSTEAKCSENLADQVQNKGKENQVPTETVIKTESVCDVLERPRTATFPKKKKSDQDSPSVRERAKAYECMLKHRTSKSPLKVPHPTTPGISNRSLPVRSKINMMKDKDNSKRSKSRGSSESSSALIHQQPHSSRSRDCQHSTSKNEKSLDSIGSRQARTRLCLKKKAQGEQSIETVTEQPKNPDSSKSGSAENYEEQKAQTPATIHSNPDTDSIDLGDDNIAVNCKTDPLNETEIVVTEVFEIETKGQRARLKEFEIMKTKTTPVCEVLKPQTKNTCTGNGSDPPCSSSDQGFNDGGEESENDSSDNSLTYHKRDTTFTNPSQDVESKPISKCNKDSGLDTSSTSSQKPAACGNSTFTKSSPEVETVARNTRTRARGQKELNAREAAQKELNPKEATVVMDSGPSTRTRQRKQEQDSQTTKPAKVEKAISAKDDPIKSTLNRLGKVNDPDRLALSDEIITGSPTVNRLKAGKKRLAEERGLSPRPKRSCVGGQPSMASSPPLSTSSPIKHIKAGEYHDEERDILLSPKRSPRPYKFTSAQKKTDFLSRTPGFGQNTSRLYSFLSTTPNCNTSGILTSFLKRNTPPPKQNIQILQEQKKIKLLEKESRDKERLRRAHEIKKRKIEEQKRQREEKERKVAEAREVKLRMDQEHKEKINKKLEDKATLKEKIIEERTKEEREKQKQRLKKQVEADARRRQEEERQIRKHEEQEEEARMQVEFMQRKKEFEEAERRRQIAEDRKRQEERQAEMEQKRLEEKVRQKKAEEEKEKERERARLEREKQIALERAERERQEQEKKDERERKIKEEMEKLLALEKERLKQQEEEALRLQKQAAQQNELKEMISKHNSSVTKQTTTTAAAASLNTSQTNSGKKSNSYDITPVKVKVVSSKIKNPENYDIEDKGSEESTDDEDAPKKRIPEWATGIPLNTALIRQHLNPPDLEEIFHTSCIEPPDLTVLFPGRKKRRYHERTSSAIWTSPVMRQ